MDYSGFILVLAGVFSICGAAFNWDWFMENRKTWLVTKLLGGRAGARVFYILLGLIIVVLGFLTVFRVIE